MATIIPNLASTSMLGVGVPKLARGLGIGLSSWTPTIAINTTDAGTVGTGKGVPIPILIAQPILYTNLLAGMVAQRLVGVLAPAFILGLSNGLVALYAQGFTNTVHVGVGTGAGLATFRAPPAFPAISAGFTAVGMTHDTGTRLAHALSYGLRRTFDTLVLPQPIVGPSAPFAGSGRGSGTIV
jgi:hypothetical protein